jgi:hypothetical protein
MLPHLRWLPFDQTGQATLLALTCRTFTQYSAQGRNFAGVQNHSPEKHGVGSVLKPIPQEHGRIATVEE